MAEELKIREIKQVVQNGFVSYTQEIVELAKQGYVLDIRNKTSPQFQLGLFICNMLLLEDEQGIDAVFTNGEMASGVDRVVVDNVTKPKRTYAKSDKAKEALRSKLPADALQTITE